VHLTRWWISYVGIIKKLPASYSIFSAEAAAVLSALKYVIATEMIGPVLICTDSKSLLTTIANLQSVDTKNFIVSDIRNKLQDLIKNGIQIRLLWVPSHIGLHGNEQADTLARASCQAELSPLTETPVTDINRQIVHDNQILWDTQWRLINLHKGKEHAKLFPGGHLPSKTWFSPFPGRTRDFYTSINRLRFAHVPTPERLHAWKLRPSPACPCTLAPGSLEHLLFDCKLFATARTNLTACVKTQRLHQPNLLPKILHSQNKKAYHALHALYKEIFSKC
jgi:ribonuclease HI